MVTTETERARREASEWHVLLREAPEDPEIRARFTHWHDSEASHAAAWRSVNHTFRAIGAAGAGSDTGAFDVVADRANAGSRAWRGRSVAGLVAVCVALVVVLLIPEFRVRMASDYATGAAETETVSLTDGTTVLLAPESAIAVTYTEGRRAVRLMSGTAHFQVAPNPDRPFGVAANGVTATVLGTAFDVALRDGGTLVEVRSGHVRVVDTDRPSAAADLRAGDWLRVDADRRVAQGRISPEFVGGWRSGTLTVRGEPIAAVVAQIRPWFAGKIVLLDDALGARRVTGVYNLRDPRTALEALVSPYGGAVTQVTPWGLLISGG